MDETTMPPPLIEVKDLHTHFDTRDGVVKAVNGVSLTLNHDSVLGVVGESGSGKTVTALSILRLVPLPGKIVSGSIRFEGTDLLSLGSEGMRHLRGKEIALIFQDASAALNPVTPIGNQIEEVMLEHTDMGKRMARERAAELLADMGIPDPKQTMKRYSFQISGGMAQRVMMAIGVALEPKVLIADEPTSNIDVTLQAEILHRLRQMRERNRSAIMLITHDMGVIAQMADSVAVMYGGTVVEHSETRKLFKRPTHPYTWALFQALPRLDAPSRSLRPLRASHPEMIDAPDQCPFLHACSKATNHCRTSPRPPLVEVEPEHEVACYNPISEIRD